MPIEPPPSRFALEPPPADHPHDLWAIGADLEPGTLLSAYRVGLFPMKVEPGIGWWSPQRRAVIPIGAFRCSRSLRRSRKRFEIRVDATFVEVMRGCGSPSRPGRWIDEDFVTAYTALHELGWAHSVEAWDAEGLAGGLYGVAIGGLFAAESKFYRRTDASKVAVLALVELLADAGGERLLDVQWLTPHLAALGAVEVGRAEYAVRLREALGLPEAPGLAAPPGSLGS